MKRLPHVHDSARIEWLDVNGLRVVYHDRKWWAWFRPQLPDSRCPVGYWQECETLLEAIDVARQAKEPNA
jgi:hypothetical protein